MASHVLVVEDDPDDADLIVRALRRGGIHERVVVRRDGVQALDYLLDDPVADPPLVMLLDLKLPRLSGLDVLRRLRSDGRTRTLPIVILTSSGEERDVAAAYELGANSYVRKPVSFDELTEVVGRLGAYWLATNEPAPRAAAEEPR